MTVKFIELTELEEINPVLGKTSKTITINPLYIKELIQKSNEGCTLIMNDGKNINVVESKIEILTKLNN